MHAHDTKLTKWRNIDLEGITDTIYTYNQFGLELLVNSASQLRESPNNSFLTVRVGL